jgi:hypothetical protein
MEKMERERKRRGAAENKKTTPFSFLTAIFFLFFKSPSVRPTPVL